MASRAGAAGPTAASATVGDESRSSAAASAARGRLTMATPALRRRRPSRSSAAPPPVGARDPRRTRGRPGAPGRAAGRECGGQPRRRRWPLPRRGGAAPRGIARRSVGGSRSLSGGAMGPQPPEFEVRRMAPSDLLAFNAVNLDHYTETVRSGDGGGLVCGWRRKVVVPRRRPTPFAAPPPPSPLVAVQPGLLPHLPRPLARPVPGRGSARRRGRGLLPGQGRGRRPRRPGLSPRVARPRVGGRGRARVPEAGPGQEIDGSVGAGV